MATSSQLIIKSYTPFKYWMKVGLVTVALLVLGWVAYAYGEYSAGFNNSELRQSRDNMAKKIDQLERFNSALREKNAMLEQSKRIDKAAITNVDSTFQDLQDEILELKQEVAFYRGILAPTESASGLNIASVQASPIGAKKKGGYHFKLVLTQTKNRNRLIRGDGQVLVNGLLNGKQKQLKLSDLTNKSLRELKLRFKYFQNIEADLVLPKGFEPSSVVIDLKPKGKGYSRVKKNYNWADILS